MGKMVLEKLLRSIPHLEHVYLLIRPKKGQEVNDRLNAIFDDRVSNRNNRCRRGNNVCSFNPDLTLLVLTIFKQYKGLAKVMTNIYRF